MSPELHPAKQPSEEPVLVRKLVNAILRRPVCLEARLARIELSAAALRELCEGGGLIELPEAQGEVELLVEGVLIGTGELVIVDDRLAVKVTSIRREDLGSNHVTATNPR